jgi:hypothetical protein
MTKITTLKFNDKEAEILHAKLYGMYSDVKAYILKVKADTLEDDGVGHIKFSDTDELKISMTMCRHSLLDAIAHFESGAAKVVEEYKD